MGDSPYLEDVLSKQGENGIVSCLDAAPLVYLYKQLDSADAGQLRVLPLSLD
jgi:hypothetical protein